MVNFVSSVPAVHFFNHIMHWNFRTVPRGHETLLKPRR